MALTEREDLAKLALTEADKITEGSVPADMVEEALYYIDRAFEYLEMSGYNPDHLFPNLAEEAVIAYARARLLGETPDADERYQLALKNWGAAAAAKHHRAEIEAERED